MTEPVPPLLPDVDAPLTAPFWAAARERRFVLQCCNRCDELRWPPRPTCPSCLAPASETRWKEVDGAGSVWSFAVYHRAFHPSFKERLPYNVAYVKLDAGPMFITNISGTNEIAIGQRVKPSFEDVSERVTLVRFRLVE